MLVAADTSVIVPALLSWHELHAAAARAVNRLLADDSLILPQQVLIEAYSVMTRLPAPHRLTPEDAHRLLSESFRDVRIAGLPPRATWPLLGSLAESSLGGGRTYDAAIARAARDADAAAILTFHPRDFEIAADGLDVIVPPS